MNYNDRAKSDSTAPIIAVCAIVFCTFTFSYLYFFQAGVLSVAQHVLSNGITHYERTLGAVIITIVLLVLQIGINALLRLRRYSHALTYFPSALILSVMTSVSSDIDLRFSFGKWIWVFPLLLVVWGLIMVLMKKIQDYEPVTKDNGIFSHPMTVNLTTMVFMILLVGLTGNANSVFHYRADAETALLSNDFDKALSYGKKSLETDRNLTMIRAYALARKGEMGEKLFSYSVVGTGDDLVPMGSKGGVRFALYPIDSLYRSLGAKPLACLSVKKYLHGLLFTGQATNIVKDYILCGYLMDCDLDAFACELPKYYKVDNTLPKHYKEALVLYTHMRATPTVVYHDDAMDTDFEDFQDTGKGTTTPNEKALKIFDQYQHTYWWYYTYTKQNQEDGHKER